MRPINKFIVICVDLKSKKETQYKDEDEQTQERPWRDGEFSRASSPVIASFSTDSVRDVGEKRGVGWILPVGFQRLLLQSVSIQ